MEAFVTWVDYAIKEKIQNKIVNPPRQNPVQRLFILLVVTDISSIQYLNRKH